jgi:hypothetical protein
METVLYEEKQTFALRNLIIAIALVVAVFGLWLGKPVMLESVGVTLSVLILVGILLWGFSSFRVRIMPTELQFGFPFYTKHVPYDKLRLGDIAPIPFWYGMGIHFIRGMWVWNARLGRGVQIDVGRWKYLLGSDHPEKLQAALMERTRQRVTA